MIDWFKIGEETIAMSKKSRAERKAARHSFEDAQALAQSIKDAEALKTGEAKFNTLEEANTALSQTARVLNMNEKKKESEKRTQQKAIKAGGRVTKSGLPALPKAKSARKPKPEVDCECGCGGKTKSRFCPGHDSYLRGLVIRVQREVMTLDEIGEKIGKGQRAAVEAELKKIKTETRTKKKEARAAGKKAVAAVDAETASETEAATGTEE